VAAGRGGWAGLDMGRRLCGAEGRCTGRVVVSNPRTLHEAKDVPDAAQKDDGVTGRIRSIPLQFMVRDFDLRSDGDVRPLQRPVRPVIGDGREGFPASDVDFIGPVCIGFAAA